MNDVSLALDHSTRPTSSTAEGPGRRPGLVLLTLSLAILVAQIDTAIVNLATRPIGVALQASIAALQWVLDSYNLVYAVLLLSGGLLADLFGRRRVFIGGAALFTAASLICGIAPSIGVLIAGRAVAGIGAALMIPASLAIIRVVWPDPRSRGRALGIWAACNGLAMAIGPTLGGVLIAAFGWRSIFFVVVPLSLAAIILARTVIAETSDPAGRRFDAGAQLLGAAALTGLAYAAIALHEAPLNAAAALVLSGAALAGFIAIERRLGAAALVPLDLFAIPAFTGSIIGTVGMTFGMYGVLFLLPLTWQSSGRLDATASGLALMPMALVFVAVSPVSGPLAERLGQRRLAAGGVAIIALGLGLIALGAPSPTILPVEFGLVLTGVGMGVATGPLMSLAVGAVPAARSGTVGALFNVARMSGATIGVGLLGALYALTGGGVAGLRGAMLAAASVQLLCAAIAGVASREH